MHKRLFEATKLTTDRHEASRGFFATAELSCLDYLDLIFITFFVIFKSKVLAHTCTNHNGAGASETAREFSDTFGENHS